MNISLVARCVHNAPTVTWSIMSSLYPLLHRNIMSSHISTVLPKHNVLLSSPAGSSQCCHNKASSSGSTTSQCKAVCKAIFIQDAEPTPSQSRAVRDYCSSQVATCISRKGIQLHTPNQPAPQGTCTLLLTTSSVERQKGLGYVSVNVI
jgi:hypothetical protein